MPRKSSFDSYEVFSFYEYLSGQDIRVLLSRCRNDDEEEQLTDLMDELKDLWGVSPEEREERFPQILQELRDRIPEDVWKGYLNARRQKKHRQKVKKIDLSREMGEYLQYFKNREGCRDYNHAIHQLVRYYYIDHPEHLRELDLIENDFVTG